MKPKILLLSITLLITLTACTGSSENLVKTCEIEQLRTLAEQGKADAQFNLYEALSKRKCGTNSPEEAKSWLVKAAENGHTGSHSLDGGMGLLAVAYDPFFDSSVIGIKKDVSQAIYWYKRVVDEYVHYDDYVANMRLAGIYRVGLGVKQDVMKGYGYYLAAHDTDFTNAIGEYANDYDYLQGRSLSGYLLESQHHPYSPVSFY